MRKNRTSIEFEQVCVTLPHEVFQIFSEAVILDLFNNLLGVLLVWLILYSLNLILFIVMKSMESIPHDVYVDFCWCFWS